MSKNIKYIVGGVLVIAIAIGIFASISSKNITYYYTPDEILSNPTKYQNQKIRVMGLVEKNSVQWQPKETRLTFRMTDNSTTFLNVAYIGSKPDLFKEGQGVVVEGSIINNNQFEATTLLVKHSEEYKTDDKNKKNYYDSMNL